MSNEQTLSQVLDLECNTLTHYLIQRAPTPYILAKYREAHQVSPKLARLGAAPFDRFLVELSRKNIALTKLVDAYTALFFRNAAVRKKMVLLLAILESCAPTYPIFDQPDANGRAAFLLCFVRQGIVFALSLMVAAILLLPLHLGFELGALVSSARTARAGKRAPLNPNAPRTPATPPEMPSKLPSLH
jgi:hypothetical protein